MEKRHIYRVTQERGSNQGYREPHYTELVYVGYEYETALIRFLESQGTDFHQPPGGNYRETKWESAVVEDNVAPDELEWVAVAVEK